MVNIRKLCSNARSYTHSHRVLHKIEKKSSFAIHTKVGCPCQTCEQRHRLVTSRNGMGPQITRRLYILRYVSIK